MHTTTCWTGFLFNKSHVTGKANPDICANQDIRADDADNFWLSLTQPSNNTAAETSSTTSISSIPLLKALHDMEESLRCLICRDLFDIPVSLEPCHHSFCSRCIRSCLMEYKKRFTAVKAKSVLNCPTCRAELDGKIDKCIKPNRSLEEAVGHFKTARPLLKQCIQSMHGGQKDGVADAVPRQSTLSAREASITKDASNLAGKHMRRREIIYSNYTRKKLQDLCKKEGLSTEGTEAQLIERHRSFSMAWNAECDSANPRSGAQIVDAFNQEEKAKKRAVTRTSMKKMYDTRQKLGKDEDHTTTKVSTGDPRLDLEMKTRFSDMIDKLKKQKSRSASKQGCDLNRKGSAHNEESGIDLGKHEPLAQATDESQFTSSKKTDGTGDAVVAGTEMKSFSSPVVSKSSAESSCTEANLVCNHFRENGIKSNFSDITCANSVIISNGFEENETMNVMSTDVEIVKERNEVLVTTLKSPQRHLTSSSEKIMADTYQTSVKSDHSLPKKRTSPSSAESCIGSRKKSADLNRVECLSIEEPEGRQVSLKLRSKTDTSKVSEYVPQSRKTRYNADPWPCSTCTYINVKSSSFCDMCGKSRKRM